MIRLEKRAWWTAAGLSGLMCGVFGPLVGLIIVFGYATLTNDKPRSFGDFASSLLPLLTSGWLTAVMIFGVPGFVLGCCGGVLLKLLAAKCLSGRSFVVFGAVLGLVLGSAVPLLPYIVPGWNLPLAYIPLGAASGAALGVIMTWLLRSTGLLDLSARPS